MSGWMYPSGIDGWVNWPSTAHVWLLLGSSGQFFDPSHDTIADVAGSELAVAGYSRKTLTGAVQADGAGTTQSRWYGCDNPAWTGLAAGEVTGGLVLAETAGRLLAFWECTTATDVGDLAFNFAPWRDGDGDPLPGGGAGTRLIHQHYVQSVNP